MIKVNRPAVICCWVYRRLFGRSWISTLLTFVTLLLLIWTVRAYFHEKCQKTKTILAALGNDRNASAAVLPGDNTVLMEPTHGCIFRGKDTTAVIMVPTLPGRRDRRETIRQTWGGKRYMYNIMLYFFVGKAEIGNDEELEAEAALHGDIIMENMDEHYYKLTIKTLRMLKWFQNNCPSSPYFIKVDDDVFVNMQMVVRMLSRLPRDFQMGGRLLLGRTPDLRNPFSKWFTPPKLWDSKAVFPSYVGGLFYVIKGSLVPKLLEASYRVPLYHLEDVFISGMVASQQLHTELYDIYGSRDPKFPWMSYLLEYYFGWESIARSILYFHSDGDGGLIRRIFEDVELAQAKA